jgi:hypothetical protein
MDLKNQNGKGFQKAQGIASPSFPLILNPQNAYSNDAMARVTKEYNLAVINPTLAKEWHPTKNGELTPFDVTPYIAKRITATSEASP